MAEIVLENVHKSFDKTIAVRDVTLRVAAGEFVTLLGPSGCGKTTCLRMVAGFVEPTSGRIIMAGRDVTSVPPHRRNTGMVFQSYALFPHKTVSENVAFGMKVRGVGRSEMAERTREALQLVHLEELAERYPSQLSGGQKQRVALARAVVFKPEVLLLDEPLGALDLKLREELQVEIKRVQSTLGMTTLFVTHDQGEALGMSDRVAVMRGGEIVQIDTPQALYERPNSQYVANFIGRTNLIEVTMRSFDERGNYEVESCDELATRFKVSAKQDTTFQLGSRCLLAVRPEHFSIGTDNTNSIRAKVTDVTYRGSAWSVNLHGPRGELLTLLLHSGQATPRSGDTIFLGWAAENCFLINRD
jgi:spermidine/putrescine ABC transporter ATP-binding subunit